MNESRYSPVYNQPVDQTNLILSYRKSRALICLCDLFWPRLLVCHMTLCQIKGILSVMARTACGTSMSHIVAALYSTVNNTIFSVSDVLDALQQNPSIGWCIVIAFNNVQSKGAI